MVALDTGATANLVSFERLENHKSIVGKRGLRRKSSHTASARFKFGDGRRGEVRYAAEITVGTAACKDTLAAFASLADIPALLREGALEALVGQLDFASGVSTVRDNGLEIPGK